MIGAEDIVFFGLPRWILAIAAGLLGAIVGSFIGTVARRLPEGREIARTGSTCDGCGRKLDAAELVPIISFIALNGKCRTCGSPIDRWQLAAEVGGAIVGALSLLFADGWTHAVLSMLLGWQLLLLAQLDLQHLWLPDRLVGGLAASSLLVSLAGWFAGNLRAVIIFQVLGAAIGFGILAIARWAYERNRGEEGMGAGDPKLMGAIGLWIGPVGVVITLLGGSLIGLAGAAAMLLSGKAIGARTALPLGTCLALAGWAVWLAIGSG